MQIPRVLHSWLVYSGKEANLSILQREGRPQEDVLQSVSFYFTSFFYNICYAFFCPTTSSVFPFSMRCCTNHMGVKVPSCKSSGSLFDRVSSQRWNNNRVKVVTVYFILYKLKGQSVAACCSLPSFGVNKLTTLPLIFRIYFNIEFASRLKFSEQSFRQICCAFWLSPAIQEKARNMTCFGQFTTWYAGKSDGLDKIQSEIRSEKTSFLKNGVVGRQVQHSRRVTKVINSQAWHCNLLKKHAMFHGLCQFLRQNCI